MATKTNKRIRSTVDASDAATDADRDGLGVILHVPRVVGLAGTVARIAEEAAAWARDVDKWGGAGGTDDDGCPVGVTDDGQEAWVRPTNEANGRRRGKVYGWYDADGSFVFLADHVKATGAKNATRERDRIARERTVRRVVFAGADGPAHGLDVKGPEYATASHEAYDEFATGCERVGRALRILVRDWSRGRLTEPEAMAVFDLIVGAYDANRRAHRRIHATWQKAQTTYRKDASTTALTMRTGHAWWESLKGYDARGRETVSGMSNRRNSRRYYNRMVVDEDEIYAALHAR